MEPRYDTSSPVTSFEYELFRRKNLDIVSNNPDDQRYVVSWDVQAELEKNPSRREQPSAMPVKKPKKVAPCKSKQITGLSYQFKVLEYTDDTATVRTRNFGYVTKFYTTIPNSYPPIARFEFKLDWMSYQHPNSLKIIIRAGNFLCFKNADDDREMFWRVDSLVMVEKNRQKRLQLFLPVDENIEDIPASILACAADFLKKTGSRMLIPTTVFKRSVKLDNYGSTIRVCNAIDIGWMSDEDILPEDMDVFIDSHVDGTAVPLRCNNEPMLHAQVRQTSHVDLALATAYKWTVSTDPFSCKYPEDMFLFERPNAEPAELPTTDKSFVPCAGLARATMKQKVQVQEEAEVEENVAPASESMVGYASLFNPYHLFDK